MAAIATSLVEISLLLCWYNRTQSSGITGSELESKSSQIPRGWLQLFAAEKKFSKITLSIH